jgi:hypothetical protein
VKKHGYGWSFAASAAVALVVGCSSSGGGGGTCSTVTGSGTSQSCISTSSTGQSTCPTGATSGSCPSAMLVGCCVITEMQSGGSGTLASCVYDSANEAAQKTACTSGNPPGVWTTAAP